MNKIEIFIYSFQLKILAAIGSVVHENFWGMDADDITSGLEDLAMLGQLAILSSRIMPEEKEKTLDEYYYYYYDYNH